ncbi:MAG: glycosyltransferase [Candidatus Omnitrophica bacterium]|nr:glycosyltransferase [Candidatus Omnitrophota bacterium]
MQKKVAIIIPAKGKATYLIKCIQSVLEVNYYLKEIFIVDDGLDKDVLAKLLAFKGKIRILNSQGRGPSFARNLAAKFSDAEFIAFTDSDCIVEKNWISKLLEGFEKFQDAVSCGGTQLLPADATNFERRVFEFMKKVGFISDYVKKTKTQKIFKVNHNPSYNVMYKREIFLKENGFLENLWPAEDVEFDYRLRKKNYILVYSQEAVVYHYKPKNFKSFLEMMYRYGLAQGFLVKKYGPFRKLHFLAIFIYLFIFGLLFLALHNFVYFALFSIIFLFLFFAYFKFNFIIIFLAIFAFFGWNLGFLKGWISFRLFRNSKKIQSFLS